MALAVTGLYYHRTYKTCTSHAISRINLMTAIGEAAQSPDKPFSLADVTPFVWSHVRIINDVQLQGSDLDCPFGWDLSAEQRADLAAQDKLTVLIFSIKSRFVDFLDLPRDEINFADAPVAFTPGSAVFTIESATAGNPPYVLRHVPVEQQ